jgi:hypothetical protein
MSTLISSPFPVFTDTDGLPLENGYINIGVAGLNPLSNPRQAYWDEALTMPATNIRTTRGYPARNGAAGFLYAAPGDFSILVRNKNGVVIFSNLNVIDNVTIIQNDIVAIEADIVTLFADKADLDSPVFIGTPTAPTAALSTVSTQLATLEFVMQNKHDLGDIIPSLVERTPSVAFPAVPLNVNTDILAANWPLLVPFLRNQAAKVLGVTDHAVNVAGNVITFGIAPETNALIGLIINDAIVTNYIDTGEPANFLNGATYAVAAAQRTITISNVDYAITGADAVARTITTAVNPPAGAQTATCYTYRVAGAATTARLLRIAGFVGVAAGDAGGEVVGGFRKMDRGQGVRYYAGITFASAGLGVYGDTTEDVVGLSTRFANSNAGAGSHQTLTSLAKNSGTNGTPRTGKTTDPRTAGQYVYTWGAVYIP